jgi:hypothetical protein
VENYGSQVAYRYGKLDGLDTINSRTGASQVKLANDSNAMALMGLNTQYVFYSGSWAFWSDADLDMNTMTIRQYDKEYILKRLNLTTENALLFSVLTGSLHSTAENVMKVAEFFKNWPKHKPKQRFAKAAKLVSEQKFPITDSELASVVELVMGRESLDDFKRTLRLMDPTTCDEVQSKIDPKVMRHIRDDYANFAEEILENCPIHVSPVYLDLR